MNRLRPSSRSASPTCSRPRARRIAILRGCIVFGGFVLAALGGAGPAAAHGPTIEISHDALKPPLLNLFVGTTVHFSNTVESPDGYVIVDESGLIESPPLEKPGDGWHYTFEKEGTYEIYVRQQPAARARIVILPKRGPPRATPGP